MKKSFITITLLFWVAYFAHSQTEDQSVSSEPSFKNTNDLRAALQPVPREAIFKMEGYYLWDPSVIKVGNTFHLFTSRWPEADGMIGWKKSHIIRATSRSLFGPYTFAEIVFEPKNHPWYRRDAQSENYESGQEVFALSSRHSQLEKGFPVCL